MSAPGSSAPKTAGPSDRIAEFDRPPVAEVVSAVRFPDLTDSTAMSLGDLWTEDFAGFSTFELQSPYAVPQEVFGPAAHQARNFEVQINGLPPLPRIWMTDPTGHELVQVQRDWFAVNWRKVDPASQYGRWPARRKAFRNNFVKLQEWATRRGEDVTPNQCEVTYINHVTPIEGLWSSHANAHHIFRTFPSVDEAPYPVEQVHWQARFSIPDELGEQRGRLHVSAQPVFRVSDSEPMVVLELTARCTPRDGGLDSVLAALDLARSAIVKSFVSLTSESAQEAWGVKR